MLTIDGLTAFGANTDEGLGRCLNKEDFYLRLVKKVPDDQNFDKLYKAVESGDLEGGFDAAHALKGVLSNLALTPVLKPVEEITELLRGKQEMDYGALIEQIKDAHGKLREMCAD